ncbi:MAG: hypothetical protein KFF50_11065, partial [Desulfatitalea sp.]|nr:hypothetical protein [Desulfatitalea sp.]
AIDEKGLQALLNTPDQASEGSRPPSDPEAITPYLDEKERVLDSFTEHYIDQLLKKTQGNVSQAARLSGLSRQALQKMLHRKAIDPDMYRV